MSDDDDLRRRATRSVGWVVAERWSSRLVTVLVLAVLTRLLTPSEFGVISLATSIFAVLQVFVDSGLSKTLIQKRRLDPKDASTAFWTSFGVSVILGTGLVLTAAPISSAFGEPQLAPVLQAMSVLFPLSALSQVPAALLERELDFKPLSIRQFIGTVCGAAVAIPLALVGGGIWALVAQTVVSALAAVIALWSSTPWRPRFEYSFDSLRSLWRIGGSILAIDLLDAIQANIDKIVIGALFSPQELGYYFIAQRVGTILIELVTSVLSRVSFTTFSRVQDDRIRLNRIFRQLTFVAAAASIAIFGLVATLAPQLVAFLFGPQWTDAVPIIWILAPGWALGAVMYFDRNVLLATSHAGSALVLAIVQNVVGTALVFLLAPFGVLGIAFSRLARFIIWPVRLVVLKRAAGVDIGKYVSQLTRCVVASIVPFGVIIGLQFTPWATAPAPFWTFACPVAVIALVAYGALLWVLAGEENRTVLRAVWADLTARLRRR
ncbi:lipopolysaccharide biosynthesis protein [Microbacterium rhizomatis]|uniref:Lipopolysaccharide biosynthesis protein n=1 Tax=Microbacterium rhizomatis TaxID=1631477 RepID=A0A5J5IZF9_9MICO|nr:lipopolysaccharide biosynthesis protein [Microbacterium rhizomatis]KAA9107792.1 lipopolysaccharide biosynthesis protein [Microbacterium rhizomatis]